MATKLYDCMCATSKYKDNNGNEKRKWENVGSIWQDKDNNGNSYCYLMLKRIFNPAGLDAREGSDAVRISLFKPKQQQQQQAQTQQVGNFTQSEPNFDNFGEPINDIPF